VAKAIPIPTGVAMSMSIPISIANQRRVHAAPKRFDVEPDIGVEIEIEIAIVRR